MQLNHLGQTSYLEELTSTLSQWVLNPNKLTYKSFSDWSCKSAVLLRGTSVMQTAILSAVTELQSLVLIPLWEG